MKDKYSASRGQLCLAIKTNCDESIPRIHVLLVGITFFEKHNLQFDLRLICQIRIMQF